MKKDWWVPLTGVGFILFAIVTVALTGEPPSVDDGAKEIVEHYVDNKDALMISAFTQAFALVLLVYFASYLRKVLRAAEGEDGILSPLALIGATIMAAGLAVDGTLTLTLAETADDIDASAVLALQALWDNDFVPIAVGTMIFTSSVGLAIVLHGALPKWLGWVLLVLTVIAVTPLGFVSFLGMLLWVLVASILLTLRNRKAGAAPAA